MKLSISAMFRGTSARFMQLIGLGLISTSLVAATAFYAIRGLSGAIDRLANSGIPVAVAIGDMATNLSSGSKELLLANLIKDPKEKEQLFKQLGQRVVNINKGFAVLKAQNYTGEDLKRVTDMEDSWNKGLVGLDKLVEKVNLGQEGAIEGSIASVLGMEMLNAKIIQLGEINDRHNEEMRQESKALIQNAKTLLVILSGAAFVLFVFLGVWMAYSLRKTLSDITDKISNTGAFVHNASSELDGASQSLSKNQTDTAASLEETVASTEELSSIVSRNADQAKLAEQLSHETAEIADKGKSEITQLISAVQGIAESSKKIDEIISIIDDIAFQTNLLALNASVEAARAGEQGKGFAVVADAVRALAQRSATAAKDISELISRSVQQSNHGAALAVRSGAVLEQVTTSIHKMTALNKEIAAASVEQTAGLRQISQAMNQLDQSTQANSASAQQTAATSHELISQAETLASLVSQLEKVVEGRSHSSERIA